MENGIVTSPRPILEIAQVLGTTPQFLRTGTEPRDVLKTPAGHSPKRTGFQEAPAGPPSRPLLDVLMYDIYDPEKMSPEEEKAVFTLQRYLRKQGGQR